MLMLSRAINLLIKIITGAVLPHAHQCAELEIETFQAFYERNHCALIAKLLHQC